MWYRPKHFYVGNPAGVADNFMGAPNGSNTMKEELVFHTIPPVYDENSRVLLLGTMPSPKSREAGFYYGHPQNRMWKVLGRVFGEETPMGTEARRAFLLRHRIAMWDVLAACTIRGAEDSSIGGEVPNDLTPLLMQAPIREIYTTGKKAFLLYRRYLLPNTGREAVCLPSTSPANCRWETLETLTEAYSVLKTAVEAH